MDDLRPLTPPKLPLRLWFKTLLPHLPHSTKLDDEIGEFAGEVISTQLQQRTAFPSEQWEYTDIGAAEAEPICQLIAHTFEWPNHHFLPQDRQELLIGCVHRRNDSPLWTAIDDHFYAPGGVYDFVDDVDSLTLAQFIRAALTVAEKY